MRSSGGTPLRVRRFPTAGNPPSGPDSPHASDLDKPRGLGSTAGVPIAAITPPIACATRPESTWAEVCCFCQRVVSHESTRFPIVALVTVVKDHSTAHTVPGYLASEQRKRRRSASGPVQTLFGLPEPNGFAEPARGKPTASSAVSPVVYRTPEQVQSPKFGERRHLNSAPRQAIKVWISAHQIHPLRST